MIRGWLVRRKRNQSVLPLDMINNKSEVTTHRNSHKRISSNAAMTDYKTMQELMKFVIEKLVSANPEELSYLIHRPFLNPKLMLMRIKQSPLDFEKEL